MGQDIAGACGQLVLQKNSNLAGAGSSGGDSCGNEAGGSSCGGSGGTTGRGDIEDILGAATGRKSCGNSSTEESRSSDSVSSRRGSGSLGGQSSAGAEVVGVSGISRDMHQQLQSPPQSRAAPSSPCSFESDSESGRPRASQPEAQHNGVALTSSTAVRFAAITFLTAAVVALFFRTRTVSPSRPRFGQ
jgi:hypothetical protein